MKRYEIKFAISIIDRAMVEQSIISHPASFSTAFPDRVINNIYFDSPDLQSYYQNINGDPIRTKVRYRWYGSKEQINSGQIELKRKEYQLGWKEYIQVPIGATAIDQVKDLKESGLPVALQATLWNSYNRSYYLSMDGNFRITIDEDLEYGDYKADPLHAREEMLIVEIKFDEDQIMLYNEIAKFFPFKQTKYSKYATGVTKLLY